MTTRTTQRPATQRGLAILLAAACATFSAGCEREFRETPESLRQEARVSLFNASHDVIPLRFQRIGQFYSIDCSLVAEDPSRFLMEAHLNNPNRRAIFSGWEIALQAPSDERETCHLAFLTPEDDRLERLAVAYTTDLPVKTFYSDVDAPPEILPEPATVMITADYDNVSAAAIRPWRDRPCDGSLDNCATDAEVEAVLTPPPGATYAWEALGDDLQLSTWVPRQRDQLPVEETSDDLCHTGLSETPLSWTTPPSGRWQIEAIHPILEDDFNFGDPGEDPGPLPDSTGCFEVVLTQANSLELWEFCGSQRLADRLDPEERRDLVFVSFFVETGSSGVAYQNLSLDVRRQDEDGQINEEETIELIRGQAIPDHIGLQWNAPPAVDCDPTREILGCDQVILPTNLTFETNAGPIRARPGETVNLDPSTGQPLDQMRRLEFVRGMHRVVTHQTCVQSTLGGAVHTGPYFEIVYYTGVTILAGP